VHPLNAGASEKNQERLIPEENQPAGSKGRSGGGALASGGGSCGGLIRQLIDFAHR
tara:strand:- start:794 stop:961 length:168 start_codon:yes stop_codon:yes gene_type:complete